MSPRVSRRAWPSLALPQAQRSETTGRHRHNVVSAVARIAPASASMPTLSNASRDSRRESIDSLLADMSPPPLGHVPGSITVTFALRCAATSVKNAPTSITGLPSQQRAPVRSPSRVAVCGSRRRHRVRLPWRRAESGTFPTRESTRATRRVLDGATNEWVRSEVLYEPARVSAARDSASELRLSIPSCGSRDSAVALRRGARSPTPATRSANARATSWTTGAQSPGCG